MLRDWAQLMREAASETPHACELVAGEPTYLGTLDASKEGPGGVWLPGTRELAPVVWRVRWPEYIRARPVSSENPEGNITTSNLEMATKLLGWLILEGLVATKWAHVGVCNNNMVTVAWQGRGASKWLCITNRLLRVLAVQMRKNCVSPLVTRHIEGTCNALGNIPLRS